MNWAYNGNFFFAPGEGSKGQISFIKLQSQSQFQRFLYQTLCLLSQMKDTKHTCIRRDFNSVVWVMPKGWDFGELGCRRGQRNYFSNMVM